MYLFKVRIEENQDVEYQGINGTGQVMTLKFEKWNCNFSHDAHWYVVFHIKDKKRHNYKFREQTGTDGLKSLIWAKQCIKDFIENFINDGKKHTIIIYWDDAKRKKAYVRYLRDLKFNLTRMDRREALVYKNN